MPAEHVGRSKQMNMNRSWSAIPIFCTALLIGGLFIAGQTLRAQVPKPVPDDIKKQVLDNLARQAGKAQIPQSGSRKVMIDYETLDLGDFINIVADEFKIKPLTIDPEIRGDIVIETATPMTRDDAAALFLLVLHSNNAVLIRDRGIYRIVPISSGGLNRVEIIEKPPELSTAKSEPEQSHANTGDQKPPDLPVMNDATGSTAASIKVLNDNSRQKPHLRTYIVEPRFVPVKDLIEAIKPFMADSASIRSFERAKLLIFTDYVTNGDRFLKMIHSLDRDPKAQDSHMGD
jgi:type II secretory pathway component GspD/PulD (secretin)